MTFRIDLNCDMGESFGAYRMGNDEAILDFVNSANIACGFHAGDPIDDTQDGRDRACERRSGRRASRLARPSGLWPPDDGRQQCRSL